MTTLTASFTTQVKEFDAFLAVGPSMFRPQTTSGLSPHSLLTLMPSQLYCAQRSYLQFPNPNSIWPDDFDILLPLPGVRFPSSPA